jgi:ABC-type multidrug transport system fused ATPase/permease subunit
VISLFINFCKINVISYITANIIEFIQENKIKQAFTYFYYFVIVSILYIVLYSIYNILQNKLLSRLRQWIRNELVKRLLIINNENFSDINFTKLNSPILRISNTTYYVFNTIITTLIPNLTLLILVFFYFVYKDIQVGIIFLLGNILVCIYLYSVWNVNGIVVMI